MPPRIVTLPGDGIGPEILAPAVEVLSKLVEVETEEHVFGGASIDAHGIALTDEVLAACEQADAVLLAAVGGPKWDTTDPNAPRPEQGLLGLRKGLGLFANLRPVRPLPALYDASPLKRDRIEGTDLLVVRELTGGIYFGEKTRTETTASDLCSYTSEEVERIARVAFECSAREGRQRRQGQRARDEPAVARGRQPTSTRRSSADIELEHVLVDNAAMQLVAQPVELRRDRHGEHVRRHPQRRGRDDHRLDRDAAQRVARAGTAPASSSRSTAARPTSPARASPTRSRCSSARR